jgi:hypothetical protein
MMVIVGKWEKFDIVVLIKSFCSGMHFEFSLYILVIVMSHSLC